MTDRWRGVRSLAASVLLALTPALASAQESKSAQAAGELTRLLDSMKLDSIATRIGGDQFAGALYFPGSQLLVVQARYSVPQRMDAQIALKNYRDVYIDLNSASVPGSKVLIADLGANGLMAKRQDNQAFDTVDKGGKTFTFDGDWNKAKISEQDYMKMFQESDAEYTKILQALLAQIKKPS